MDITPPAIHHAGSRLTLAAGLLEKSIALDARVPGLASVRVAGQEVLAGPSALVAVHFARALPDAEPRGMALAAAAASGEGVTQENTTRGGTDGLVVRRAPRGASEGNRAGDLETGRGAGGEPVWTTWEPVASLAALAEAGHLGTPEIDSRATRACITIPVTGPEVLAGVTVEVHLAVHALFPAVRQWVVVRNAGSHWIKIDRLVVDPLALAADFQHMTDLTPSERGAAASVRAFDRADEGAGLLLCSEIPSALRAMDSTGAMGYADEFFEWVLGPGEQFTSEPVFAYAYAGKIFETCSARSTPRDRTVEGPFREYVERVVGVRADPGRVPAPLWCTWSNFHAAIDDAIVREQAELAAAAGFRGFQIDAGWSDSPDPRDWSSGSRVPHPDKFPDFASTCAFVRAQGLQLGLWLSCFRNARSPDLREMPEGRSVPFVRRGASYGMSFASPWREYYARDLQYLHDTYGATYFKQDLTNVKFGDIAEGHDSRTRVESHLRALRGFFETQDALHAHAPEACTLLSHELYWGTPGTPCDLAAIKHCWSFHIPPNDYSGAFPRTKRIQRRETRHKWNRWGLLRGCLHARKRFHAHRGLPLYCIEYYGAATVNKDGSLTPRIQDRQVCSWLAGIPSVYAGDLGSLTPENLRHYKARFALLARLQEEYGIYRYYQYSGVPAPTDWGWHWWGKLNPTGEGVVVVMRGVCGGKRARVNVPWVPPDGRFRVTALFAGRDLGVFSGEALQAGRLQLSLPRLSQELLEVSREDAPHGEERARNPSVGP